MADVPKFEDTLPEEDEQQAAVPKFDDTVPVSFDDTEPMEAVATEVGPSQSDTLGRTFAQGFTGGIADEAYGVLGAIVNPTNSDKGLIERYLLSRDYARRKDAEAEKANPKTAKLGHLVGGVGMAMVPGLNVARGAKAGEVVGKAAAGGAITGLGSSEGESVGEVARDTVAGGALGATFGKIGHEGGKLASNVGAKVKEFANERAVKSLGPMLSQMEALNNKGGVQDLGAELLDDGVTRFGSTTKGQLPRLDELLGKKGAEIGAIRQQADEAIAAGADPIDLERLLSKGNAREAFSEASNEATQKSAKAYRKNAESLSKMPKRTIEETQGEIQAISEQIPFNKPMAERTAKQQALTDLRRDLVGMVDDKVREISPEQAARLKALKGSFGLLKDGEGMLEKAVARKAVNRDFGLTDYLAALQAGSKGDLGGGLKGMALAGANKLARERGNSMLAVSANKAAQVLQSNPEVLGKFAAPLTKALQKGNTSFLAAHQVLMNDPTYRKLVGEDEGVE